MDSPLAEAHTRYPVTAVPLPAVPPIEIQRASGSGAFPVPILVRGTPSREDDSQAPATSQALAQGAPWRTGGVPDPDDPDNQEHLPTFIQCGVWRIRQRTWAAVQPFFCPGKAAHTHEVFGLVFGLTDYAV